MNTPTRTITLATALGLVAGSWPLTTVSFEGVGRIDEGAQPANTGEANIRATLVLMGIAGVAGATAATLMRRDTPAEEEGMSASGQDFTRTRPRPAPFRSEPRHDPDEFRTPAYNAHPHLEQIRVAEAYQWGHFGEEVTIGIVDALPDAEHTAFTHRFDPASALDGAVDARMQSDHGTWVSGVAAANPDDHQIIGQEGAHGVAPGAKIRAYGVEAQGHAINVQAAKRGLQAMANADVPIVNLSFGLDVGEAVGPGVHSQDEIDRQAAFFDPVRGADIVLVYAAGNDRLEGLRLDAGMPFYDQDLESQFLVVTAIDNDGRHVDFANKCDGHDWCLAAPGIRIRTAGADDGVATRTGTSFSAAIVSGALAVTMSRFPGISAQEARERVLVSADDSAPYDDESIFGRGKLDLAAALEPIGDLRLQSGDALYDDEVALHSSGMRTSAPWTATLAKPLADVSALAFDRYGGGFAVDLSQGIEQPRHGHDLDGWMQRHLQAPAATAPQSGFQINARALGLRAATAQAAAPPLGVSTLEPIAGSGLFYGLVGDRDMADIVIGYINHDPEQFAMDTQRPPSTAIWTGGPVSGPVLGASAALPGSGLDGVRVGLQLAQLDERDAALGLSGSGGFGLDGARHQLVGGELVIPGQMAQLQLNYERVTMDVRSAGMMQFDNVAAHGWGVAVSLDGLRPEDTFGVGFQRPVHVRSGRVAVDAVTGRETDGTLQRERQSHSLDVQRPARWHATYTRPFSTAALAGRLALGYQHDRLAGGERADLISAGVALDW